MKTVLFIFVTSLLMAEGNVTINSDVKEEFAKKWAEVSATLKEPQQGADGNLPLVPQLPPVSEEEEVSKESRLVQERLNIHMNKIKKEMLDDEINGKASIEVEPQYIEVSGKSEYYIPYRTFLEVKLFFANKEQNKYTMSQASIQSYELQNITQELQMMLQQDTMVTQTTQAATVLPMKPKAKREKLWVNKDYGTFIVTKVSPTSITFIGK